MSDWSYALGMDFGVRDMTSFTVAAYRDHDPVVYICESYGRAGMGPTDAAVEFKALSKIYDFDQVIGDVGGLGKGFAQEMISRHSIPVKAAAKHDKLGFVTLFNAALRDGKIKVVRPRCEQLIEEWLSLPWADNGRREAEGFKADCSDSCLYVWRAVNNYHNVPLETEPLPGTVEFYNAQERRMEELAEEHFSGKGGQEWWQQ